jgi:hypothetical protein
LPHTLLILFFCVELSDFGELFNRNHNATGQQEVASRNYTTETARKSNREKTN